MCRIWFFNDLDVCSSCDKVYCDKCGFNHQFFDVEKWILPQHQLLMEKHLNDVTKHLNVCARTHTFPNEFTVEFALAKEIVDMLKDECKNDLVLCADCLPDYIAKMEKEEREAKDEMK